MMDKNDLTELQIAIMNVVWENGEATVADVLDALPQKAMARTTAATLLSRLEKQGFVTYRKLGSTHVYRAVVEKETVERSMVSNLVTSLYEGDVSRLVSQLLSEATVDAGEIQRVTELIQSLEKRKGRDD